MNKQLIQELLKKYNYEKNYEEEYKNKDNNVFHFEFDVKDNIFLRESCDSWFFMNLDSKKCEQLSNLFKELSILLGGDE